MRTQYAQTTATVSDVTTGVKGLADVDTKGSDMVQQRVLEFLDDEAGTTLVEYGMLVMLIALLCIAALKLLGSKVSSAYSQADALLP